ncbi:MAG: SxtJ family membrane protein [Candidatus Omnitrophota bacterium]|nr:hypothetical protein [Candidatus Omnitrophota bacterium]MBU1929446.1 hypothetical protein [Candidatus Omnitrophota bacterium]MBU2034830.1 hypothetical protein [Candidatus Omnitrophota bacterium]MBU2258083.1 hypothetical protein [Candidatus Omnitrophota bacterium]
MENLKTDERSLRKYGITMFVALVIIGTILLFKQKPVYIWFYGIGSLFLVLGVAIPGSLKQVYIIWMKLAFVLGWINTRIILALMFYLVFTPIGLVMKLFGKDLLDRKIEKNKESYWKKREVKKFNPMDYEHQF